MPGKLRHVHPGTALPVRGSGASLLPAFLALPMGWEKGTSLPLCAPGPAEHLPAATELCFDFGTISAPVMGIFSWSPWQRPWLSLCSSPLASHTLRRALKSPSPQAQTARQLRNLPLPLSRSRRHFQRGRWAGSAAESRARRSPLATREPPTPAAPRCPPGSLSFLPGQRGRRKLAQTRVPVPEPLGNLTRCHSGFLGAPIPWVPKLLPFPALGALRDT